MKKTTDYEIEEDLTQLAQPEQAELYRKRTLVAGTITKMQGCMQSLKGAMVFGTSGQKISQARTEITHIKSLCDLALAQLGKSVGVVLLVVSLTGCGGQGGVEPVQAETVRTSAGCSGGMCRVK